MNVNYFQKSLLILSFFIIAPLSAMKRNESISKEADKANAELLQIINATRNNDTFNLKEQNWKNIKKCLENGADPDLRATNYSETPLFCLATENGKKDICDLLLERKADINASDVGGWTPICYFIFSEKFQTFDLNFLQYLTQHNANIDHKSNNGFTPLGWVIYKDRIHKGENSKLTEIIEKLLQVRASIYIDDFHNTIFHKAAKNPEGTIKTLMTHVNFKNNDDVTTNTIKTVLLVFNRLSYPLEIETSKKDFIKFPVIPLEIQILILSKLLSPSFFHTGLFKKCGKQLPLELVNKHIQHLQQILQIENKNDETALQKLSAPYNPPYNPPQNIKMLLDGTELQKNLDAFNQIYPDLSSIGPDNLALQILENHYVFESK